MPFVPALPPPLKPPPPVRNPTPPHMIVSTSPDVTGNVACTLPRGPGGLLGMNPDPLPPSTSTVIDVTPAGTMKDCGPLTLVNVMVVPDCAASGAGATIDVTTGIAAAMPTRPSIARRESSG